MARRFRRGLREDLGVGQGLHRQSTRSGPVVAGPIDVVGSRDVREVSAQQLMPLARLSQLQPPAQHDRHLDALRGDLSDRRREDVVLV